ncbi:MAG: hypothetical protein AB1Y25_02820 [Cycloclasticus sp.]
MKIFAMCMECQKELGHPSFVPIIADYYEGSIAYIECNRKHKSALMLQSQKFEILMESAANALLEGYTLEAVSSFSAAYERFFEFAILVLCKKRGVVKKELDLTFKQVSRQSERQIGAFLFLHLLEFNCTYEINKKTVEFRNKVVHKGYIPTPKEAEDFAEKIYTEISGLSTKLKAQCGEQINQVIMDGLQEKNKKIPKGMPVATTSGTMFFSLVKEEENNFQNAIASYKESQETIFGAVPYLKFLNKAVVVYKKFKNGL